MLIFWIGLITAAVFGAWVVRSTSRMLHPLPKPLIAPAVLPETRAVMLRARDGAPFEIWILDGAQPLRGVVIACHGYTANHLQLLEAADGLRCRGYTTMLFDLRGHGGRSADACTFGVREVDDIGSILAWVRDQPALRQVPIGLFGWSLGGAIACQAAMQYPEVGALVLDSTYARFFPMVARAIRKQYPLPTPVWVWLTWWGTQARLGARLARRDPVRLAASIATPVLLILGAEDQTVPLEQGRALYDQWRGPKTQWIDPHAAHVRAFANDPAGYCARVADFFDRWLVTDRRSSPS